MMHAGQDTTGADGAGKDADMAQSNGWTWGACVTYAERNAPGTGRAFATWAHETADGWHDHETVNVAFDRWQATDCYRWHALDRRFGTDARSPLHHDGRCSDCKPAR